jgi:two-component system OmpR family sensor kinase/two-component system sensor histidine kinase BaeS
MRNHLWFRLTLAFALVILAGVLVTVLLTRSGAATQLEHFMVDGRMVRPLVMQQVLADHYFHHRNWEHVAEMLPLLVDAAADGVMSGMMGSMMGMRNNRVLVFDQSGRVVANLQGDAGQSTVAGESGPLAQPVQPVQHWPIVVDGAVVGSLAVQGALMSPAANANLLVGSVTRTVLLAALSAGAVALVLAALIVRQITRPLNDLSRAAQRIAGGDLSARVTVRSSDEIGALGHSFNQMAGGLQQQEQLRRNLVADVAHELRTPLTGLQGAVEAMQDGVFPVDAENLGALHEEIMLLNRLVDDLRTLANAEAGQLTLQQHHFDVAELCRRQAGLLHYAAQARSIHLEVAAAGPLLVCADEQRIGQVLHNLLDNALRYTQEGGCVTVAAGRDGSCVVVTVTDDGAGIAAEDLAHIFDRFYRGDRTRVRSGSGLGLAIARQLVLAHGGDVWVQSPPPGSARGSVFGLALRAS